MNYGLVTGAFVRDNGGTPSDRQLVGVQVDFLIDRSVLFEFMDAMRPIDESARREPIQAILDYSAKLGAEVSA